MLVIENCNSLSDLRQKLIDGEEVRTRQEPYKVSEYDKDHIWYKGNQYISLRRFLEVKAKAEKEPCEDAISRQAAIDIVDSYSESQSNVEDVTQDIISDISALPPATPQPKTGQWIVHEKPYGIRYLECPHCNIWYLNEHLIRNSYCPNCGAKMVESQERSEE